jgi:hypothetical protein
MTYGNITTRAGSAATTSVDDSWNNQDMVNSVLKQLEAQGYGPGFLADVEKDLQAYYMGRAAEGAGAKPRRWERHRGWYRRAARRASQRRGPLAERVLPSTVHIGAEADLARRRIQMGWPLRRALRVYFSPDRPGSAWTRAGSSVAQRDWVEHQRRQNYRTTGRYALRNLVRAGGWTPAIY